MSTDVGHDLEKEMGKISLSTGSTKAYSKTGKEEVEKVCFFLDVLPFKLREIIYRELYLCADSIVPRFVDIDPVSKSGPSYAYMWDHRRPIPRNMNVLPYYNGTPDHMVKTWTTPASGEHHEELRLLQEGKLEHTGYHGLYKLPYIADKETGEIISRELYIRPSGIKEIVHHMDFVCSGIYGLAFLRTNKQIMQEGIAVLYGENKFVLDAGQPMNFVCATDYTPDEDVPQEIAAVVRAMEHRPAFQVCTRAQRRSKNPRFLELEQYRRCQRDPLTGFLAQIGFTNAARIQNIRIDGVLELLRIRLPLYCRILDRVCYNLKHLGIFQKDDLKDSTNYEAPRGTRAEESLIRELVYWLPGLQQLRLESKRQGMTYETIGKQEYPMWGKAVLWEVTVAERYEKCREEVKAAETVKKIQDVAEYVTKR